MNVINGSSVHTFGYDMNRYLAVHFCILGLYFISNSLSYITISRNKEKYLNQNLKRTPICLYYDCNKHFVLNNAIIFVLSLRLYYCCYHHCVFMYMYFLLCESEMWQVVAGETRTSIGQDYKRLVLQRSLGSSILRRGLFLVSKGRGHKAWNWTWTE